MPQIVKVILALLLTISGLVAVMITPIDNTAYTTTNYYTQTMQATNAAMKANMPKQDTSSLKIGWAKVNLTPAMPTPMAGYTNRAGKVYASVHDSIFVRVFVLANNRTRVAIVSADMLIIPPAVTQRLLVKLQKIGFSLPQVFLGATHTHNSIGAWGEKWVGNQFAGQYNSQIVEFIADKIVEAIAQAAQETTVAQVAVAQTYLADMVQNRLVGKQGTIDPYLRLLEFKKTTGEKAIFCTYSAHATTLNATDMILSRDYPGALVDSLENKRANFAMFMAGAVGSMAPLKEGKSSFEQLRNQALGIQLAMDPVLPTLVFQKINDIRSFAVPVTLRESHWRFVTNWRLRPWVFRRLFGEAPAEIKVLKIGNTLMVGMPCDFSGELIAPLASQAQRKGLQLVVTSFNGGYIGYITPDKYYNLNAYETRVMNWYGLGNGAYFSEIISKIIAGM